MCVCVCARKMSLGVCARVKSISCCRRSSFNLPLLAVWRRVKIVTSARRGTSALASLAAEEIASAHINESRKRVRYA